MGVNGFGDQRTMDVYGVEVSLQDQNVVLKECDSFDI